MSYLFTQNVIELNFFYTISIFFFFTVISLSQITKLHQIERLQIILRGAYSRTPFANAHYIARGFSAGVQIKYQYVKIKNIIFKFNSKLLPETSN